MNLLTKEEMNIRSIKKELEFQSNHHEFAEMLSCYIAEYGFNYLDLLEMATDYELFKKNIIRVFPRLEYDGETTMELQQYLKQILAKVNSPIPITGLLKDMKADNRDLEALSKYWFATDYRDYQLDSDKLNALLNTDATTLVSEALILRRPDGENFGEDKKLSGVTIFEFRKALDENSGNIKQVLDYFGLRTLNHDSPYYNPFYQTLISSLKGYTGMILRTSEEIPFERLDENLWKIDLAERRGLVAKNLTSIATYMITHNHEYLDRRRNAFLQSDSQTQINYLAKNFTLAELERGLEIPQRDTLDLIPRQDGRVPVRVLKKPIDRLMKNT